MWLTVYSSWMLVIAKVHINSGRRVLHARQKIPVGTTKSKLSGEYKWIGFSVCAPNNLKS